MKPSESLGTFFRTSG